MKPKTSNILMADLSMWKGHHATYFKILLKNFIQHGYFVYCSSANNKALRQFIEEEGISEHCVIVNTELSFFEKIIFRIFKLIDLILIFFKLDQYCKLLSLFSLARTNAALRNIKAKDVFVFFPSLDTVLPIVPTWISKYFFPPRWAGINVTPPYCAECFWGKEKKRRRAFQDLALQLDSCKAIFVIHPIYITYYRRLLALNNCYAIPEPIVLEIDSYSLRAKQIEQKARGRKIIVMLGGLGKRRNFLLFLKTALFLDKQVFFLAAVGQFHQSEFSKTEQEEIKSALATLKNNGNIYAQLDSYIYKETEFNALINVADFVYLHYQNHPYSSNQLLKTIALKKIAIVRKGYLMEKILKENNWPIAVNNDPVQIALAISSLVDAFIINELNHLQFVNSLSNHQLQKIILEGIKGKMIYKKITSLA